MADFEFDSLEWIDHLLPEFVDRARIAQFRVVDQSLQVSCNLVQALRVLALRTQLILEIPDLVVALLQFTNGLSGIEANREQTERFAEATLSAATALNPYIGYDKATEIVKKASATGPAPSTAARIMSRKKPLIRDSSVKPPTVRMRLIIRECPWSLSELPVISPLEPDRAIAIARYLELP